MGYGVCEQGEKQSSELRLWVYTLRVAIATIDHPLTQSPCYHFATDFTDDAFMHRIVDTGSVCDNDNNNGNII